MTELTEAAYARVLARLGEPEAQFDPSLDPWLIVNMETTVSVPEDQWNTVIVETETVGPVSVTVTGRPSELRLLPGDGSAGGSSTSSRIRYTYRRVSREPLPSGDLAFAATVELGWTIEIDRTFGGDETRTSTTTRDFLVPVAEVQTVEVGG